MTDYEWNEFLDKNRCFHRLGVKETLRFFPKARQRFLEAMKLKPIIVDEAVVKAKSLFVTAIVGQLTAEGVGHASHAIVIQSLKEYQERIETLLTTFSDGDRFRSLPGVDVILASKLLVVTTHSRERFASATELQSFFGTAPYTKGSGQYRGVHPVRNLIQRGFLEYCDRISNWVHFCFACNKTMRTALEQMALASRGRRRSRIARLRSSAWAKSYFARKRKEGKKAYHALRCLANLWLKVIFAIWKNQENYDETKHLASIARHQLNQVTSL